MLVWDYVGKDEGFILLSWEWKVYSLLVGSIVLYLSGFVVVICLGGWVYFGEIFENDELNVKVFEELSLKFWGILLVDVGG